MNEFMEQKLQPVLDQMAQLLTEGGDWQEFRALADTGLTDLRQGLRQLPDNDSNLTRTLMAISLAARQLSGGLTAGQIDVFNSGLAMINKGQTDPDARMELKRQFCNAGLSTNIVFPPGVTGEMYLEDARENPLPHNLCGGCGL